jgi:hypothetical protein
MSGYKHHSLFHNEENDLKTFQDSFKNQKCDFDTGDLLYEHLRRRRESLKCEFGDNFIADF